MTAFRPYSGGVGRLFDEPPLASAAATSPPSERAGTGGSQGRTRSAAAPDDVMVVR